MLSLHFFLAGVSCFIQRHSNRGCPQRRWRPESPRWPECAVGVRVVSMRNGPSSVEEVYPWELAAYRSLLSYRTGNGRLPLIPFYFRQIRGLICPESRLYPAPREASL